MIRVALWIIGEYAESLQEAQQAFNTVKKSIGSLPIYTAFSLEQTTDEPESKAESSKPREITKTVILPDGSYGTQTIIVDDAKKVAQN